MGERKEIEKTESPTNSIFRPPLLSFTASYPSNGLAAPKLSNTINFPPATLTSTISTQQSSTDTKKSEQSVPQDYVFGSNISSRVVNADLAHGASEKLLTDSDQNQSANSSVFTTLAKAVSSKSVDEQAPVTLEDSATRLSEVQKRSMVSLEEVEVFTGEEGEVPIVREHCRAYLFNIDKRQWNSLGASYLHLNDVNLDTGSTGVEVDYRSRIVVRLATTKRVVLNTPVWAQMPVALVDFRNLRLGTISEDGGHIRTFLFKFPSAEPAQKLYDAIIDRKEKMASKHASSVAGKKRPAAVSTTESSAKVPYSGPGTQIKNSASPSTLLCRTYSGTPPVHFRQSALDAVVKKHDCEPANVSISPSNLGNSQESCELEHKECDAPCTSGIDPACEATLSSSKSIVASLLQNHSELITRYSSVQSNEKWSEACVVLDIQSLFYHFDILSSNWTQRGIAAIHLQDLPKSDASRPTCSRMLIQVTPRQYPSAIAFISEDTVVRTVDDRCLLMVTACYHDFSETVKDNPIDISCQEPTVSGFLLVTSPGDSSRLFDALISRVNSPSEKSEDTVELPCSQTQEVQSTNH